MIDNGIGRVVYICGPMSGFALSNRPAFNLEAYRLTNNGYNVLNPAALPDGLTQSQYMSICLPMLMAADSILMLCGWEESLGALAEKALAEKLGKAISFQHE